MKESYQTRQGALILQTMQNLAGPVTAEALCAILREQRVSKATVYRHLERLTAAGQLRRFSPRRVPPPAISMSATTTTATCTPTWCASAAGGCSTWIAANWRHSRNTSGSITAFCWIIKTPFCTGCAPLVLKRRQSHDPHSML
ncbi:MAG: hypothetical protein ACLTY5_10525 [Angelakisella sp.]